MTIAGETEELGENLPSATLSHHKSYMPRSGFEPRTAEVGSQRLTALSYGAAETCQVNLIVLVDIKPLK
jgi:hypothetical protein